MQVVEITDHQKEQWNNFVQKNAADGGLLQSWQWGEFKQALGLKIYRLAVVDQKDFLAMALLLKHQLPLGQNYFYIPRGPVISQDHKLQTAEILKLLFKKIKELAAKDKSIFLKVEPTHLPVDNLINLVFKKSEAIQPTETLILDLSKSEQELLAQMKQKTRYNIRLAEKKEVTINKVQGTINKVQFEEFWRLMKGTAQRQKISNFPKNYYSKMVKVLDQEGILKLFLAEYKGNIIAANLVAFFGNFAYYLFGGQSYEFREVMAPHLLQWHQILEAKRQGKRFYDFWGVSRTKKSWQGITRFKTGFAPNCDFTQYIGGYDYVYKRFWYLLYKTIKRIKK